MIKYCDYDYYKNTYSGTLPESSFNRLAIIGSSKINSNTFNRIDEDNITDDIKNCLCAIVDNLNSIENRQGKNSESVGSWSVSYDTSSRANDEDESCIQIMKDFLPVELMYRGINV